MLSQVQVMKKTWDETFLLVFQKIETLRQLCKVYIIAKNIETETLKFDENFARPMVFEGTFTTSPLTS